MYVRFFNFLFFSSLFEGEMEEKAMNYSNVECFFFASFFFVGTNECEKAFSADGLFISM